MSDSDPVDDYGQYVLMHYSRGTLVEITNWIEREIIVCSPTPTSSIFYFSHGVKKVLVTFIRTENFDGALSLWQAIVGREFRAEDGACPARTPLFKSHVCYIMAQVILATDEYTRYAGRNRIQLGSFLRAAIFDHQYVDNPMWIANLRELCRRALLCVGFEDSDNELLRFLQVQEEASLHYSARPEAPPQPTRRSSLEAREEAPEPIMYCPKHKQQLLLLSLGTGERRPSDANQSGEQDSSSSVSSVRDPLSPVIVIDSSTETGELEPRDAGQAEEQDNNSREPLTRNPSSPVIVIDSSTESGELGPGDSSRAEEQDNSSREPSTPNLASPAVIVIDSSTESSMPGPIDAGQAGEQDYSTPEPSVPHRASPAVIVIDSSTESSIPGPTDAGQAGEQDYSSPEPSVPHRASPEVIVIDSSTESSGGPLDLRVHNAAAGMPEQTGGPRHGEPLDLRVHDVARMLQQAGGSRSGDLGDGQSGQHQKLDSDSSD